MSSVSQAFRCFERSFNASTFVPVRKPVDFLSQTALLIYLPLDPGVKEMMQSLIRSATRYLACPSFVLAVAAMRISFGPSSAAAQDYEPTQSQSDVDNEFDFLRMMSPDGLGDALSLTTRLVVLYNMPSGPSSAEIKKFTSQTPRLIRASEGNKGGNAETTWKVEKGEK